MLHRYFRPVRDQLHIVLIQVPGLPECLPSGMRGEGECGTYDLGLKNTFPVQASLTALGNRS